MGYVRTYPPPPPHAHVEGVAIAAIRDRGDVGRDVVSVYWHDIGGRRWYRFRLDGFAVIGAWLGAEHGARNGWRRFPDWGAAIDAAHEWAEEVFGGGR